jgi:hypothetical protein
MRAILELELFLIPRVSVELYQSTEANHGSIVFPEKKSSSNLQGIYFSPSTCRSEVL